MQKTYTPFSKDEFEEALASYSMGEFKELDTNHKEIVYQLELSNGLGLEIFSSIDKRSNWTRSVGSDAIRIVPLYYGIEKTRSLGRQKRTYRTTNWKSNLKENIKNILKFIHELYRLGTCGHLLTKRTNYKTQGHFWGCLEYPMCKNTEEV